MESHDRAGTRSWPRWSVNTSRSGEPVSSSVLAGAAGLGVSSATVRNILAQLEDDGFVQQPHTSAGRIPTDRGYRFYVDLLLESKRSGRTASAVEARLRRDSVGSLVDSVLTQVSHVVSQASEHVGFAIRPAHEAAVFDRVEFIPLERVPRAGGHRRAGRACAAEGDRCRRAVDGRRAASGGELPQF